MMGTKVVFGLLALFLVAVHFADAQVEGGRKCKTKERYGSVGNQNCNGRPTEWKTVVEEDNFRIDCRCRRGIFRVRQCVKCNYETSTTTVAPTTTIITTTSTEQPTTEQPTTTQVSTDATTVNPVTDPATAVPSTEIPDITSPNPGTSQVPVNPSTTEAPATSENPAPTVPATQGPPQVPSVPTEVSVDTTIAP